ncbi:MAG: hypothetical protein J6A15_07175 [Clostridia bacterium]|nr:hypothetical protein [Clostridia bacterium]
MINIYILNSNQKTIKEVSKIGNINVNKINIDECAKYEENIKKDISKDNKFYYDYLRLYIAYKNGGLVIDGNVEIVSSLDSLFEDTLFLGYNNTNTILTNIIYSKNKANMNIAKILETIRNNKKDDIDITDIVSLSLNINLKKTINTTFRGNGITIYSYDYFYPIDYEKNGKQFSENTKIIYYANDKLGYRQKTKLNLFKKYGAPAAKYLSTMFDVARFNLARKKYNKQLKHGIGIDDKKLSKRVDEALIKLDEYKSKKAEYVIIHNPYWLGVTSATKELFTNLLPLEELYSANDIDRLAKKMLECNIKQVIFSAFNNGWDMLARKIKEYDKNIKVKVFWHGSNSQVIEFQNWNTNVMALNLQKEGIVDVFATCKESMLNFYTYQGYNTAFIKNTVNLEQELLNKILAEKESNKNTSEKLKIGMYSANMDWRKNMFNQLTAASLIENSEICSIPLNFDAEVFCSKVSQPIDGIRKGVPREELLMQMAKNDINLYVTFSECAPMLPIESMEVGTLCITGDNHHYFKDTPLEEYLVVKREDDVIAISDKVKYALENKDKIFELYNAWKKEYDITSKKSVEEFLEM